MLFNSFQFLPFIIVVLALYYILSNKKQNLWLLLASYVFYGVWDYRFLVLILISTIVDYLVGQRIHHTTNATQKKKWLLLSMITNLGILCFFKYFNFFVASTIGLFSFFGLSLAKPVLTILLPAGISFYTFKTMSYIIDVYRGQLTPCTKFTDYALYIAFFPQLVAGPIERASNLLPQITQKRLINRDKLIQGLWLILWGLYKKMVVADNLAVYVNNIFTPGKPSTGFEVLMAVYAFTFQIYCDFSGYSDIARGIAKLLGFETILNFNHPYLSTSPVEFWKRWHISLSTWLRDYIFLPIAYATMRHIKKPHLGLKVENWGYIIGIFLTMLLGGLWHGANWTFVFWGGYHGFILLVHHIVSRKSHKKKRKRKKQAKPWTILTIKLLKIVGVFHMAALGWLFFRAQDFEQMGVFFYKIFFAFSMPKNIAASVFPILFYLPVLLLLEAWLQNCDDPRTRPGWQFLLGPITVSVLIISIILLSSSGQGFLYAQF